MLKVSETAELSIVNGQIELENHKVVTEDGYVLTLSRIRSSSSDAENDNVQRRLRPPVLIVHGIFCSSLHWLMNRPDKLLPKILEKAGYDCWLANIRGTTESKSHKTLSADSSEFWDFSVDQIARYDIPALVDYILKVTDNKRLYYIGHSMGCLSVFSTLSLKSEYCSKIIKMIALAPSVSGNNVTNIILKIGIILGNITSKLKGLYCRQAPPYPGNISGYLKIICPKFLMNSTSTYLDTIGAWILNTFGVSLGIFARHQIEYERLTQMSQQFPETTSLKTLYHLAQLYSSDWRQYDHGKNRNLKYYGQETPPAYDLKNVNVPIAIFYSKADTMCPAKDIIQATKLLPNIIGTYEITDHNFAHLDFTAGKTADKLVYEQIIQIFEN